MRLVGYCDRLSVEPGADVEFMISSASPTYEAGIVRLIHGDVNPAGPGFKAHAVDSDVAGTHPGRVQRLHPGSYVRVPHTDALALTGSFTIHLWIRPTMPDKDIQTLVVKTGPEGAGFALRLGQGHLALHVGPDPAAAVRVDRPVELHTWYSVTAVYDAETGIARLWLDPLSSTAAELRATASGPVGHGPVATTADLLVAAELVADDGDRRVAGNFYNGKIEAPRLFARALDDGALTALRDGGTPTGYEPAAWWDFSVGIPTTIVTDRSAPGSHGRTVNRPVRAMTGHSWDGSETAWRHAPEQYGAIHFHDDDLDDAGWEPSLRWTVPDGTASGIYALHVHAGDHEDHIPFVVRPTRGRPTAKVALLLPTFSYLAYANEHVLTGVAGAAFEKETGKLDYPVTPHDTYVIDNRLGSLYDLHSDGSGVCYSSMRRPMVNMRPKVVMQALHNGKGSPHQLNADLHLVDWLTEQGYDFDVVTDHDLHAEGVELLAPYRAVLTGTHHEYWSGQMIAGAQQYLRQGGRLLYLAGNGMYWVTEPDPETGHSVEVRRLGPSTRNWDTGPGEGHLSSTGEQGGLWRYRGHPPQSWLGVGFTAQAVSEGRPYERQPDSFDERAAWVFEGVDDNQLIGDVPCLVQGHGAAGLEIDRIDHELGTPYRTLLLATATGFSDAYQHVLEEVLMAGLDQGGTSNPLVKADMTLLEHPNGGAVFSTGSISWCGCLSYNGYDNDVSRITRNVLDRFASDVEQPVAPKG